MPESSTTPSGDATALRGVAIAALIGALVLGVLGAWLVERGALRLLAYDGAHDWQRTPMWIDEVDHRVQKRQKSSTLHTLTARYHYTFGGVRYFGTRLSFDDDPSSDGYMSLRASTLEQLKEKELEVMGLVDPQHPDEAVIFREITESMILLPMAGAMLFGLAVAMLFGGRVLLRRYALVKRFSQEWALRPWKTLPQFCSFVLSHNKLTEAVVTLIMGAYWLMLSVAGLIGMLLSVPFQLVAGIMITVFQLPALLIIARGVYLLLQMKKYGTSHLHLRELPVVLGRPLIARLEVNRPIAAHDIKVKLVCKRTTAKGGKKYDVETLYEVEQHLAPPPTDPLTGHGDLRLSLDIPADKPPRHDLGRSTCTWTLTLSASTPGIDFFAEHELPVYAVYSDEAIERNPQP